MFADDDPIVYEPFNKENGLQGKAAIKSFLQVAAMANRVLEKTIEFLLPLPLSKEEEIKESKLESDAAITALVTFKRGGESVKGKFEFHFVTDTNINNNNCPDKVKEKNEDIHSKTLDQKNNNNSFTNKIKMLKINFI